MAVMIVVGEWEEPRAKIGDSEVPAGLPAATRLAQRRHRVSCSLIRGCRINPANPDGVELKYLSTTLVGVEIMSDVAHISHAPNKTNPMTSNFGFTL
uniref:Uncharacterized protein n=1 Tax=Oryza punctata TaxID=4537 RepID=A0A0E0K089_ORYPU